MAPEVEACAGTRRGAAGASDREGAAGAVPEGRGRHRSPGCYCGNVCVRKKSRGFAFGVFRAGNFARHAAPGRGAAAFSVRGAARARIPAVGGRGGEKTPRGRRSGSVKKTTFFCFGKGSSFSPFCILPFPLFLIRLFCDAR